MLTVGGGSGLDRVYVQTNRLHERYLTVFNRFMPFHKDRVENNPFTPKKKVFLQSLIS